MIYINLAPDLEVKISNELITHIKATCATAWRNLTEVEPDITVEIQNHLVYGKIEVWGSYSLKDKIIRLGIDKIKCDFSQIGIPLEFIITFILGHEVCHKYQTEILGKKLIPVEEHTNYRKCRFELAAHKVGMKTIKAIYKEASGYFYVNDTKIEVPIWTKFKYYSE